MYRSRAAVTGTNDTPLPNRRWGPVADDSQPPPPPPQSGGGGYGYDYTGGAAAQDRGRDQQPRGDEPAPGEPRKRRSRWGDATEKVNMPGLPTAVTGNVSQSELDNYAIHIRLEEINRKLNSGDIVPPERMRSPSPPPMYDSQGRRTNTRDVRYRKKLEDERVRLVDKAIKADPNFKPPAEYTFHKRNNRPQEKVYIPAKEFPEINFFGLLVGPRGNSLKGMENASGAKISIRGKGSVKPGKERNDQFASDEHDELHCLVMGDTQEKVDKCVKLINTVIETAASTPEGQNDHKRNQLRELASLNGTLRDDENQLCQNCGEKGHRKYECPQARSFTANVICRACGNAGHMARDCFQRNGPPGNQFGGPPGIGGGAPGAPKSEFDNEYANLMAELGEGGQVRSSGPAVGMITNGAAADGTPAAPKVPPWRVPENWFSNNPNRGPHMGGGGGYGGHMGGGFQGGYQQHQQGGYGGGYQQQQQQPQQQAGGYPQAQAAAGYGAAQGGYDANAAAAAAYGAQGGYDANAAAAWAAQGYGSYGQQQSGMDPNAYAAYYASLQQQQQQPAA